MSGSFLAAATARRVDLERFVGAASESSDEKSLSDLPTALIEIVLSFLPYTHLGAACCTCRAFHCAGAQAAELRRERESLHALERNSSESWLQRYVFAELLELCQMRPKLAAADEHSLLCTDGEGSEMLSWG